MSTTPKHALVIGAGLVGSLWATVLAKEGYTVDVYERRPDMRKAGFIGGRSINLALSDRGWKALRLAGIDAHIRESALPMHGRMMHNTEGELTFQPYGKSGQAIYSVSRGGLNLDLLNQAETHAHVTMYFDHRCLGVDFETGMARFEDAAGKRKEVQADLVFATDGAFSAVRNSMMKRPLFNYAQHYLEHGYKELSIPPNADGSHRMDAASLHIWPRRSFMLIALPNPDGSFTCTLFLPFSGGADAFDQLDKPADIEAFFQRHFPDVVPLIPNLVEEFQTNPTSSLVTVRCSPWQVNNRVFLMGDAAHAIVPFYGQGMNSGFEDCSVLHGFMKEHNHNWKQIGEAYNRTRIRDGHAIADLALRNFIEMRDLVADPKFILRKKILAWLQERHPSFLPLYSMVTFSHIPYHEAWEAGLAQDQLFEEILALPNIEERWNSPEVEAVFLKWRAAAE